MTARDYEDKIHNWLKERNPTATVINLNDTEGKFSLIDLELTKGDNKSYFEIKNRRYKSTDFKDSMIEEHKYKALCKKNSAYYVCIYSDYTLIFDIHKAKARMAEYQGMNRTDFTGGQITTRLVYYLDNRDAKRLKI